VPLGDEGGHTEGDGENAGELSGEAHQLVHVPVLLQGEAHHAVHLEALETGLRRVACGAEDLLLGVLPVDEVPHPLARPVRGHGECPGTSTAQRVHELLGEAVRPEGGDAHLSA
jgi:hypothetical protein